MGHIFSVIAEKVQNDRETWYMIDSSFITTLPDTWGIGEKFLMLPVNKWDQDYQRVVLGGITCDSHDYYDSEEHINEVFLPKQMELLSPYMSDSFTPALTRTRLVVMVVSNTALYLLPNM